jgi:hypothetical protein
MKVILTVLMAGLFSMMLVSDSFAKPQKGLVNKSGKEITVPDELGKYELGGKRQHKPYSGPL